MCQEPNPTLGSQALLSRIRSLSGTWQSLGMVAAGTSASYRPGLLSLFVDICDPYPIFSKRENRWHGVALACLRINHFGPSISAGWVPASDGHFSVDIDPFGAIPQDAISVKISPLRPTDGIDEAIAWLEAQLRRPIQRIEWTREGETVARLWLLADTGRRLVQGGPPAIARDPQTADSVRQILP